MDEYVTMPVKVQKRLYHWNLCSGSIKGSNVHGCVRKNIG